MTGLFEDLQDNERFGVSGVPYVKGQHPAYQAHDRNEAPPNAYRPDAPYRYIRFEPTLPVTRARLFQDLPDGQPFGRSGLHYVKGQHPAYQSRDPQEMPPNAYRLEAPHLYVRFGSETVVFS